MNILIRSDASNSIGGGHIMRCLTIANALSALGHKITFVCRDLPGHFGAAIINSTHSLHLLPSMEDLGEQHDAVNYSKWLRENWQEDVSATTSVLEPTPFDWVIVDHYDLDRKWESAIREISHRILVIDDLADRPHDCDLLLDQTHDRQPVSYEALTSPQTNFLLGSSYALLRPEFRQLRKAQLTKPRNQLSTILIALGGTSHIDMTQMILAAIRKNQTPSVNKVIVVGIQDEQEQAKLISDFSRNETRIQLVVHGFVDNLAELYINSDLVIGAPGGSSWERCCLGLPSLLFVLAENQRENAHTLANEGAAIIIENEAGLIDALHHLASSDNALNTMAINAQKMIDGKGAERVIERLVG